MPGKKSLQLSSDAQLHDLLNGYEIAHDRRDSCAAAEHISAAVWDMIQHLTMLDLPMCNEQASLMSALAPSDAENAPCDPAIFSAVRVRPISLQY